MVEEIYLPDTNETGCDASYCQHGKRQLILLTASKGRTCSCGHWLKSVVAVLDKCITIVCIAPTSVLLP